MSYKLTVNTEEKSLSWFWRSRPSREEAERVVSHMLDEIFGKKKAITK